LYYGYFLFIEDPTAQAQAAALSLYNVCDRRRVPYLPTLVVYFLNLEDPTAQA
jgi:hypothetical protein